MTDQADQLREALKRVRQGYQNILEFRKLDGGIWGQRDGYGGRYGALTREEIEAAIAGVDAALSAPPEQPPEGMTAEKWQEHLDYYAGLTREQLIAELHYLGEAYVELPKLIRKEAIPTETESRHAVPVARSGVESGSGLQKRSCNRHDDCEEANQAWLTKHPGKDRWEIPANFHCHDEDCEDCFGQ